MISWYIFYHPVHVYNIVFNLHSALRYTYIVFVCLLFIPIQSPQLRTAVSFQGKIYIHMNQDFSDEQSTREKGL